MAKRKKAVTKKVVPKKSGKKAAAVAKAGKKLKKKQSPIGKKGVAGQSSLAEGPVSLNEAKTLAQMSNARRSPRRTISANSAARQEKTTIESVAKEQDKLRKDQQREDERRIREYSEVMKIMKRRGVKELGSQPGPRMRRAPVGGAGVAAAPPPIASGPLQVLAEGDSWFDYPPFLFKGGVINRLEKRLGVPILNLAKAGDVVRNMLGVTQRKEIETRLKKGCPAGGAWDVMLFSGGGNDIVGDPMALWIRDYDASFTASQLIHKERFAAAMQLVLSGYEDLIKLRNDFSPTTHLVFHGYDYAIPDGRDVCGKGPWLEPTFAVRKFPTSLSARFEVVKEMLSIFAIKLRTIASANSGVTFVETQGTLDPKSSSWHNELHPSREGFDLITEKFYSTLKAKFPTRVQ